MKPVLIIIILLTLGLIISSFLSNQENFYDESNSLDKIDSMDQELDSLIEKEKETRTFCKLLRHDSSNQEQLKKVIAHRNQEFENNWKKQNNMLSDIKKKIIGIRLGENNKQFTEFNTGRNKDYESNIKRKKIMETVQKMIKKQPEVNLTIDNNI
jgi:hypothetical protein